MKLPRLLPTLPTLRKMSIEKIIMLAEELRIQAGTQKPRFGYARTGEGIFVAFCVEHETRCLKPTFREALIEYCVVLVEVIEMRCDETKG